MHVGEILKDARRKRRLSQLDLALALGVSQRHVSFVEGGRSGPSRTLIEAWLRETEAPLSLRNAALHRAGYAPRLPGCATDPRLAPALEAIRRMLAVHEPCPGLVFDADWMARYVNGAGEWLVGQIMPRFLAEAADPDVSSDMIAALTHPGGLLSRLRDPWSGGGAILDQLRREEWTRPALGPRIDRFEASMLARFGSRPAGGSGGGGQPCLSLTFDIECGAMSFVTFESTFALPQDVTLASLRVELWFPADEATRAILGRRPPQAA